MAQAHCFLLQPACRHMIRAEFVAREAAQKFFGAKSFPPKTKATVSFLSLSLGKMQRRSSARTGGGVVEKSDSDPGVRPNSLTKRTSDYSELDTETVSTVFLHTHHTHMAKGGYLEAAASIPRIDVRAHRKGRLGLEWLLSVCILLPMCARKQSGYTNGRRT
jgi:hypothetical protein